MLDRMRVLVIEDEVRLATAIARGLEVEGFDVDVAHDGLDGLWRACEFPFDAVTLDLLLPGMNGYKICAELRRRQVMIPVLVLTAKEGEFDEAEILDLGADDFLRKPFSYVVLAARLRALIRRSRDDVTGGPVVAGDLWLDPFTRSCRRGSAEIRLSDREASVLDVLLRAAGEPVAKLEVLDRVWGGDFDGDPNIVEVYIGHLRRKIDDPFGLKTLRTIRGVGYQLLVRHG